MSQRDIEDFGPRHLQTQEPVIITDLYAGDRISEIDTIAALRSHLGDILLHVGVSYYDTVISGRPEAASTPDYLIALGRYLDVIAENPRLDHYCREQLAPPEMRRLFAVPSIATQHSPTSEPVCLMYAANDGIIAPLHFDRDQREVLFTALLGKKRIFLVKPAFGARLCPIRNFAGTPVHLFPEDEKLKFFDFNDGYACVLEPGETLYIPKLWWHYLENIGATVAFNVRFGLTPANRRLRLLPSNYLTQNIARDVVDPTTGSIRDDERITALLEVFVGEFDTPEARLRRTIAALEDAYTAICHDAVKVPYLPLRYRAAVAGDFTELAAAFGYSEPVLLGKGDLRSPCEPAYLAVLRQAIAASRLSSEAFRKICVSYGFSDDLDRLTLLEADLLLQTVAAPSLLDEFVREEADVEQFTA